MKSQNQSRNYMPTAEQIRIAARNMQQVNQSQEKARVARYVWRTCKNNQENQYEFNRQKTC